MNNYDIAQIVVMVVLLAATIFIVMHFGIGDGQKANLYLVIVMVLMVFTMVAIPLLRNSNLNSDSEMAKSVMGIEQLVSDDPGWNNLTPCQKEVLYPILTKIYSTVSQGLSSLAKRGSRMMS